MESTSEPHLSVRPILPVHVVGIAATEFVTEHDAMLDELVFDVVYRALREAGLRKQDLGLSVSASMDVLDGRSISSGLTNAASGGYLSDAFRVEGDAGVAIVSAAEAIASGDVEVAVAVGVHNPETTGDAMRRGRFLEQVSNLAFDPHFDRPVGLTANTAYGLHAARVLAVSRMRAEGFAALAASEISRSAGLDRSVRRRGATAQDVLDSVPVAWPLHELMLPAHSAGAVAVVLASPARAGRCVGRDAKLTGLGHSTGGYTWTGEWLADPGAATRRATRAALATSGASARDVALAEVSAPTPHLHQPLVDALGIDANVTVNPSGGMRSNFPGLANGGLRLLEVVERIGELPSGSIALSHSLDTITGGVAEDATVIAVEAA